MLEGIIHIRLTSKETLKYQPLYQSGYQPSGSPRMEVIPFSVGLIYVLCPPLCPSRVPPSPLCPSPVHIFLVLNT